MLDFVTWLKAYNESAKVEEGKIGLNDSLYAKYFTNQEKKEIFKSYMCY